jgi:hypothetical protein
LLSVHGLDITLVIKDSLKADRDSIKQIIKDKLKFKVDIKDLGQIIEEIKNDKNDD